jgi:hypothetical protein
MPRALLLIADIGGYTRFMKVHRINLAHAQHIVARLLEAVIDGAGRRLKLAKLEGDAAFFYAIVPTSGGEEKMAEALLVIRKAFLRRRDDLAINRLCTCDGCTQAGDLKLKFVAHVGEVAFQKVKRYTELAGVDVILVHRLLKNSVPVSEYVLMSEPVREPIQKALGVEVVSCDEDLEGLGATRTYWVDLNEAMPYTSDTRPSFWSKLTNWVRMTWRSLPYFIGLRKACDGFQNMGEVLPRPSAAPESEA